MIANRQIRYYFIASLIAAGGVATVMMLLAKASVPEPVIAIKGDYLGLLHVRVIPIPTHPPVDPIPPPMPLTTPDEIPHPRAEVKAPSPVRVQHHDICTAHHMHKEYTQNGKSWRCRK